MYANDFLIGGSEARRFRRLVWLVLATDLLAHACYRRIRLEVGQSSGLDFIKENLSPMSRRQIAIYDEKSLSDFMSQMPEYVGQSWQDM